MYSEAAFYRVRIALEAAVAERSRPRVSAVVLIVSSRPILAQAYQEGLTHYGGPAESSSPLVCASDLLSGPDLVLLLPQCWQELAHWLTGGLAPWASPGLLIAEARLAGMFLARLEQRVGTFLPPETALPVLWRTVQQLLAGHRLSLRDALRERFARGAVQHVPCWTGCFPTMAELQCGCAVSLGLGNREIAQTLCISEATVKCYVHQLLEKFDLTNRRELGTLFYQAFTLPLVSPGSPGAPDHSAEGEGFLGREAG